MRVYDHLSDITSYASLAFSTWWETIPGRMRKPQARLGLQLRTNAPTSTFFHWLMTERDIKNSTRKVKSVFQSMADTQSHFPDTMGRVHFGILNFLVINGAAVIH